MKTLFTICALLLVSSASARTFFVDKSVLLRVPDSQTTHIETRRLSGLISKHKYESAHFKIVLGKSDEAISLNNPDSELQLKAATVYYHLMKARQYWIEVVKSEKAASLHKITVRLEITNTFSDIAHFMSDNMEPEFNNALSIPAGTPPEFVNNVKPWKEEIWFRPKKVVATNTLDSNLGENPLTQNLRQLEGPIQDYAFGQFRYNLLQSMFFQRFHGAWQDALWFGGTLAVMKVIIEGSKKMDRFFLDKWYYLDTAMVPEVIFHEYAHVVLSDKLALSHSTAVIEGMADYFAATIASNYLIYGNVPGRSTAKAKDGLNKNPYRHYMEHNSQATADFVLSVLWRIRQEMPDVANELIYNARNYLSTDSATIYDSFLRAILNSCNDVCKRPLRDRNKLYQVFSKKGL